MLRRQKWQKRLAVAAVQRPLCLYTEDDADFGGNSAGMCFACAGSLTAVLATGWGDRLAARSPNCPTCRAPFSVEDFKRCWKLVHDRSPGQHTPAAQCNLGYMYRNGRGVEQDNVEATTWYRKAAWPWGAMAQCNLGHMYRNGRGAEQDHVEAATWYRKAV